MKVPESASEVFAIDQGDASSTNPQFVSGFVTDMGIYKNTTGGSNIITSRLTQGKYLLTESTAAEATSTSFPFDYMDGWRSAVSNTDHYSWMFKRSPGFFDVVCYTGTGVARTVDHNLGVAPEMMWVKNRDGASNWIVYHEGIGNTDYLILNQSSSTNNISTIWNDTTPTDSVFTVGTSADVNQSGIAFIAYLFTSLAGISKCGSYTGDGTNGRVIDCGFSSGARFVLIKRTDGLADWHIWDTERGIVAGNDPWLELNTTNAEDASYDVVDPDSSGFIVNDVAFAPVNRDGQTYIYYAIA